MHNVEPLVALRGITKSFPGILANDRVDFDVYPGEIHALLGENGAGKSTLVKVLYGIHQADTGTIQFGDRAVQIRSPHDARRLGIGMVFQQFTLIPALSVVENVALFLPHLPAVLDHGVIARRIEEVSGRYGLAVDPWAPAWRLSVGEQQKVEILKLLLARSRVLILDEPTRVLVPHEIDGLFRVLAGLREHGYAVVFITHKLPEVLTCADRITVMRGGTVAGTLVRAEATERGLVGLMFGTAWPEEGSSRREPIRESARPLLELREVDTSGDGVSLRGGWPWRCFRRPSRPEPSRAGMCSGSVWSGNSPPIPVSSSPSIRHADWTCAARPRPAICCWRCGIGVPASC